MSHGDSRTVTADRAVAAALAGSAAASAAVPEDELEPATLVDAARAWRWVVGTSCLELYAVPQTTPQWRATWIGAGAALHRARVALAADGLAAHVDLMPDAAARREPIDPPTLITGSGEHRQRTLLARVTVTGTVEVTAQARALYEATDPDVGPVDDHPETAPGTRPSRSVVRELVGAARAEGVRLRLIRVGPALVGVLHGPDTRLAWLRAGMAASAVRLLARQHGLTTTTTLAAQPSPATGASPAGTAVITEPSPAGPGPVTRPGRSWGIPPSRANRSGWRRISDREGWLTVGIGTPYLLLRLTG